MICFSQFAKLTSQPLCSWPKYKDTHFNIIPIDMGLISKFFVNIFFKF
jgi:hypothetical protein